MVERTVKISLLWCWDGLPGRKEMHSPFYTHISWWIYRTLKMDQSFSTPRSLHISSPLSTLSLWILESDSIYKLGRVVVVCRLCTRYHTEHLCYTSVHKPSKYDYACIQYMSSRMCMCVGTWLHVLSRSVNYQHWVLFMFIITCFIVEYLSQGALAWLWL